MLNFQPTAFPGAVLSNSDYLLPLNVSIDRLQSFFRACHLSERGLGHLSCKSPVLFQRLHVVLPLALFPADSIQHMLTAFSHFPR